MRAMMCFNKGENIRYISHLDILRLFQRAAVRAELPMSYSQGYNPHMLIGFACALPTGAMSEAEYGELTLSCELECEEIMKRLNAVLPLGCKISLVKRLPENYPSLMAIVARAEYRIEIVDKGADRLIAELVEHTNGLTEVMVNKKTKKGMKLTDIKGMIYSLEYRDGAVYCELAAGNSANLRPDTLMEYFRDQLDCFPAYRIYRTGMMLEHGGLFDAAMAGEERA